MNQTEVRMHIPICTQLDEELLGFIGMDGDYLVFRRPKGGQILIHRDQFRRETHPHEVTFK